MLNPCWIKIKIIISICIDILFWAQFILTVLTFWKKIYYLNMIWYPQTTDLVGKLIWYITLSISVTELFDRRACTSTNACTEHTHCLKPLCYIYGSSGFPFIDFAVLQYTTGFYNVFFLKKKIEHHQFTLSYMTIYCLLHIYCFSF